MATVSTSGEMFFCFYYFHPSIGPSIKFESNELLSTRESQTIVIKVETRIINVFNELKRMTRLRLRTMPNEAEAHISLTRSGDDI